MGRVDALGTGEGIGQIKGGNAADTINGVDKTNGAGGADILTGCGGNDVLKYGKTSNNGIRAAADRITEFVIGADRLNFSQIDANAAIAGDQAFGFVGTGVFTGGGAGSIRYQDSGADLFVQVDVNGDGVTDMEIILGGLAGHTLAADGFTLGSTGGEPKMLDVMDVLGDAKPAEATAAPVSTAEIASTAFETSQNIYFSDDFGGEVQGLVRYYKNNNVLMGPLEII